MTSEIGTEPSEINPAFPLRVAGAGLKIPAQLRVDNFRRQPGNG